jgi:serine/threonine protein phosphatase PrpC
LYHEFIVLGSDGLYGEMTNEEIVTLVDQYRAESVDNMSERVRNAVLDRIATFYGFTLT